MKLLLTIMLALAPVMGMSADLYQPTNPWKNRVIRHSSFTLPNLIEPTLINGTIVNPGSGWDHVVFITTGSAGCTATIVGPQAIITAAHCANTGATSTFTFGGKQYSAKMTRAPLYPGKDHDICVGKVTEKIAGLTTAQMATIGGVVAKGKQLTLLGYGCTNAGGGSIDGKLRIGKATITDFSNYDAVSTSGAALCYGDSGGPGFLNEMGLYTGAAPMLLATINSKGNISDTNYTTRLDLQESKDFLKSWATTNATDLCGVTAVCGDGPTPPGPQTIGAENAAIKVSIDVKAGVDVDFVRNQLIWFMKYVAGEK